MISSVTEVYVDSATGVARVQWSKGLTIGTTGTVSIAATAPHNPGDVVVLPTGLVAAKGTYVIWSEVSYKYTPAIGYMVAKTGMSFSDTAYTRPRSVALRYISDGWQLHLSDAVTAALSDKLRNLHRSPRPSWKRGGAVFSGLHWFRLR